MNLSQIALDPARGLEFIQNHTVPAYIRRDIKSANVCLDRRELRRKGWLGMILDLFKLGSAVGLKLNLDCLRLQISD